MQRKKESERIEKYEIYCLYHDRVYSEQYGEVIDKITFVKMGDGGYIFPAKKHIHLSKEVYFKSIGKEWAEYEFYYSLYKGYLSGAVELPEYVGFIHYDMGFHAKQATHKGFNLISFIEKKLQENLITKDSVIFFRPALFEDVYEQNIVMDLARPDVISDKNSLNCIDVILDECNRFTGRSVKVSYLENKTIPMCGSFFAHRSVFIDMMRFISQIIESGKLEVFDKRKRMQGQLLERYIAIFLSLSIKSFSNFTLSHDSNSERETLGVGMRISLLIRRFFRILIKKKHSLYSSLHGGLGKMGKLLRENSPFLYGLLRKK